MTEGFVPLSSESKLKAYGYARFRWYRDQHRAGFEVIVQSGTVEARGARALLLLREH